MINKDESQKIKVLSFDGDMTLWDFNKVMRLALNYTLLELQEKIPGPATAQLSIDQMIEIRNETAQDYKGKYEPLEEIRYQAFRRTLLHIGVEDDVFAAELNTLYLKHRFEDIELYEDTVPVLLTLKSHYQLGLCSNGNSYPERCGLSNIFDFTVFAQDVGAEKPDKQIFIELIRQAGSTPESIMHIGDSLINDIWGAQRAGLTAVWLNRTHTQNNTHVLPDAEINKLTDLFCILGIKTVE